MTLNSDELERYGRHLALPEIGREGQERLLRSKVLVVGVGGLGSPAALYLAAAGVGTIGLADPDRVERSNLQRQILYRDADTGGLKVKAAGERLREFNPTIMLHLHEERLSAQNAKELIRDYDAVVGATDNFPSRYEINRACLELGKPNVYGAVFQCEGQVSVFAPGAGPCYECLFPEPPGPEAVVSGGGILGALAGVIGTIQATETIKCLIGKGDLLIGRLLLYNALQMRFREIRLQKRPACRLCHGKRD
jgi:adenylyltransferase/sulfurtransferase